MSKKIVWSHHENPYGGERWMARCPWPPKRDQKIKTGTISRSARERTYYWDLSWFSIPSGARRPRGTTKSLSTAKAALARALRRVCR